MDKIPQLRILATDYCNRRCIYCRPSGEAVQKSNSREVSLKDVKLISKIYKSFGGTSIKISGGDPVFWKELVSCIKILKNELEFDDIELITRTPLVANKIDDLINAGLSTLNFSLDTVNPVTYKNITGGDDYTEYIEAIKFCSTKIDCKINSVIMNRINVDDVNDLINFCEKNSIKQLKLLDIISDLHDVNTGNEKYSLEFYGTTLRELYYPLENIAKKIANIASKERVIFQGGLGHPMNEFEMKSGLKLIIKDANNGAWYGNTCSSCNLFPCHDALMALRLIPGSKLQICLLNSENCFSFDNKDEKKTQELMMNVLNIYNTAQFSFVEK